MMCRESQAHANGVVVPLAREYSAVKPRRVCPA